MKRIKAGHYQDGIFILWKSKNIWYIKERVGEYSTNRIGYGFYKKKYALLFLDEYRISKDEKDAYEKCMATLNSVARPDIPELYSNLNTQKNKSGFSHENADCSVRALALVTGLDYADAHNHMKVIAGRKDGTGVHLYKQMQVLRKLGYNTAKYVHSMMGTYQISHNYKFDLVKAFGNISTYPTKKQILKNQDVTKKILKGRYLAETRGHVFAIIDGVVQDHTIDDAQRITGIYKIVEEKNNG